MPSDIDALLRFLRENEGHLRSSLSITLADSHIEWIAAVEAIVKQQGDLQDSILVNDPRNSDDD